MGDSKRRAEQRRHWLSGLGERERTLVRVAEGVHALRLYGACYRTALFLRYHLEKCYGLIGEAVVGYVNDGTDEVWIGHAWYELGGAMTDVTLCRPQVPGSNPGAVIILGLETMPGWRYAYARQRPPEGETFVRECMANPDYAPMVAETEAAHQRISSIIASGELSQIRDYLDGAPDGMDYKRMAAAVES